MTPWDEERPGFLEIDLVAHCGDSAAGQFLVYFAIDKSIDKNSFVSLSPSHTPTHRLAYSLKRSGWSTFRRDPDPNWNARARHIGESSFMHTMATMGFLFATRATERRLG
jgi:hypothetical protein